jgi:hypothetical protein
MTWLSGSGSNADPLASPLTTRESYSKITVPETCMMTSAMLQQAIGFDGMHLQPRHTLVCTPQNSIYNTSASKMQAPLMPFYQALVTPVPQARFVGMCDPNH